MKVFAPEDCGNAPRKLLLRNLTIANARGDFEQLVNASAADVVWHVVGDQLITGKKAVEEALVDRTGELPTELHIRHIITHGATAAINGIVAFRDGRQMAFCHLYVFTSAGKSARIKEVTSYHIEIGL